MFIENKIITLASFVDNSKVVNFKNYLNKKFDIPEDKIFQYSIDDETKKILTFRITLNEDKIVDTNTFYPKTIIVHKKGECFYTINALNELIEKVSGLEIGNIEHRNFKINWSEYQNKFILIKNQELKIIDIKKYHF
jgi:hypothetical protein